MRASIPVLFALTIGCATGAVARDVVAPARAQGQVGPNYEYTTAIVKSDNSDNDVLVKYGQQGWRLVAAAGTGSWRYLYFERQLGAH
jgi:hypothetical protein